MRGQRAVPLFSSVSQPRLLGLSRRSYVSAAAFGKKVVVTRQLPEQALAALRAGGCEWEGRYWDEAETAIPRATLLSWLSPDTQGTSLCFFFLIHLLIFNSLTLLHAGLYCLLTDRVDAEVLDRAPNLRVVSSMVIRLPFLLPRCSKWFRL